MLTSTGTTDQYESELVITSNWTDRSRTIGIRIRPKPQDETAVGEELRRYGQYMTQVRGLAPKTREGALRLVGALLRKHFGDGDIQFEVLTAEHVRHFFASQAKNYSTPSSLGAVVASLRGYFRWRASLGERTHALVGALAYPANWQLASLPKSLEPAEVEQLEAALGQSGPSMLRVYGWKAIHR